MNLRSTFGSVFALSAALALASEAVAVEYKVDPVHSTVMFRVKHMNASMAYGRFNAVSGTFALDSDPAKCAFDVTVKTDSIDTASPDRDKHLKNTDFFNAKQFPTIAFKSKSVASAGQGMFEVTGDLTMHGVTKPVTVKMEHTGSGKGMKGEALAGVEAVMTIKRSDFGMKGMVGPIGDDVRVIVSLEGAGK